MITFENEDLERYLVKAKTCRGAYSKRVRAAADDICRCLENMNFDDVMIVLALHRSDWSFRIELYAALRKWSSGRINFYEILSQMKDAQQCLQALHPKKP